LFSFADFKRPVRRRTTGAIDIRCDMARLQEIQENSILGGSQFSSQDTVTENYIEQLQMQDSAVNDTQ
jgi:hypothetical protein